MFWKLGGTSFLGNPEGPSVVEDRLIRGGAANCTVVLLVIMSIMTKIAILVGPDIVSEE